MWSLNITPTGDEQMLASSLDYCCRVEEPLGQRLRAWRDAGLIDAATARAIEDFEASRAPLQPAAEPPERVTASEALTYVGVAVVMAGVLFGLFTGVGGDAIGPVVLILAVVAAVLGIPLRSGATASSRRAAGAAFTVAAAMAALGTGELLYAAGAFAGPPVPYINGTTLPGRPDIAAVSAIAAAVGLVLFLVVLRVATVGFAALLTAAAAYTTAMTTAWVIGQEAAMRSGLAPLIAGAFLLALAARTRSNAAAATLRFTGTAVPAGILLVIGQMPDANTGVLIALATLVSLLAVSAAVRLGANELAVAGGIGIFGVALDVTARTLGRSAGAPVVLILSGLLLVACAALVQRAIRHNKRVRPVG